MAKANIAVKIEGLDELRDLVDRLEQLAGRPVYGDVHMTCGVDYAQLLAALKDGDHLADRRRATGGIV